MVTFSIYLTTQQKPTNVAVLWWYSEGFKIWALCVALPGAVSFILLLFALGLTVCSGLSRELGDMVVITDTYKIFRQAFSRMRLRGEAAGVLDMAKLSRGGYFADGSVDDRRKIMLLAILSACVAPSTFAMFSTHSSVPDLTSQQNTSTSDLPMNEFAEESVSFYKVVFFSAIYVGAISAISFFLIAKCCSRSRSYAPLTKWQAGQAVMIAVTIIIAILDKCNSGYLISYYSLCTGKFLLGISDALIYITGYKLSLLAAPRSMQTVSFGMFKGALLFPASLIALGFKYCPISQQWIMEVAISIIASIGFIILFLLNRYVDLGFN